MAGGSSYEIVSKFAAPPLQIREIIKGHARSKLQENSENIEAFLAVGKKDISLVAAA